MKATVSNVYLMDRALEPEGEARSIGDTLRALADRLDLPAFYPWADQAAAVDALLAGLDGGRVTVDRLRQEDGRYAKQVASVAYADLRFPTPSGKLELYSARCAELGLSALPVYEEPAETPRRQAELARHYPLVFRQGRTLTHFHAFYDEGRALPSLARLDPGPTLWIHPADAAERGIATDDSIAMFNQRGDFAALAKVTTDVPPGVVWMRDGWAGINRVTSGQASYEALVKVRRE